MLGRGGVICTSEQLFSNWYATIEHGVPFVQALIIAFDQHLAQTAHFDEAALRAMPTAVRAE